MKFNRDFGDDCTLLWIYQKTLNGWMYLNKGVKNSVGICVKLGRTMIIVQLIFIFIFSFFNLPESMVKKVCNMEKYQVKSQYLDYTHSKMNTQR